MEKIPKKLIIVSRKSRLAIWQAEYLRNKLAIFYPKCKISILGITTQGDQILDKNFHKIGGKSLFIQELEIALIKGYADLAVHSLKDMPVKLPLEFTLACVLKREDPRDAFISNTHATLDKLPQGSIIGTNSLRRQAFIAMQYPHLITKSLRGNLDTRLNKLDQGQYHGIILAAAGLKRLQLEKRIKSFLKTTQMLPAPGQGVIAVEILNHRHDLKNILLPLNHSATACAITAERTVSSIFNGSCQIPLAAFATVKNKFLRLKACISALNGSCIAKTEAIGPSNKPVILGQHVARLLNMEGAKNIITTYYS